jgi:hypothetical protein
VCAVCGVSRCQPWREADSVVLRGLVADGEAVAADDVKEDEDGGG